MIIEVSRTEDSVILYSDIKGYYVEDRNDVCVIESFSIESSMLSNEAAKNAIQWYKEQEEADQEILEEILSSM